MFRLFTLQLSMVVTFIGLASTAQADFGEIDLIVQESIENFFREIDREVELNSLTYQGEPAAPTNTDPTAQENSLEIKSSVRAEHKLDTPYITDKFIWFDCITTIKIQARGTYQDQGTTCDFDL